MTVERREEKVGKPLLTGSALGGDKFRDICDMETIPPETDVLINNAHFPSFTSPTSKSVLNVRSEKSVTVPSRLNAPIVL